MLTDTQMLSRLATDPRDAEALISVYEHYEREIRAAAISWIGNKRGLYEQAVNTILVAIGRRAHSYDPQSMDAAQWVRNCADTEARRLREALDTVQCARMIETVRGAGYRLTQQVQALSG